MNFNEKIFWDMQKNCISYAKQYQSEWIDQPTITEIFKLLVSNEKELDSIVKLQGGLDHNGFTSQNNVELVLLLKQFYRLGRKLTLFAKDTCNKEMLRDVNIPESTLLTESDDDVVVICNQLINRGREVIAITSDYDVTAQELDRLEEALKSLLKTPTETSDGFRKSATRTIKELNVEANELLSRLDDSFENLIDNQDFLEGWFQLRKIKGRAVGRKNSDI